MNLGEYRIRYAVVSSNDCERLSSDGYSQIDCCQVQHEDILQNNFVVGPNYEKFKRINSGHLKIAPSKLSSRTT